MASAEEWQLDSGTAQVFPASAQGIVKPVLVAADRQAGPTDLAAFAAGLDHGSYSFLAELHARGYDLVLIGYRDGDTPLTDHAHAVRDTVLRAASEQLGPDPLIVGGIGHGALAARYALAEAETRKMDHRTGTYFSYNGVAPSAKEHDELERLGDWPVRPRKLKLVSGDFASKLNDDGFHACKTGAANGGGPLITKELGTWLLSHLD
ncbi:hypothetical protein ACIPMU_39115 [Streptomyces cyaneofuscatus]|uniref:hypothetical protein n=1 Tax=Streptomyces cyaneofuscatus TaxID=66883 RepID=UPI003807C489